MNNAKLLEGLLALSAAQDWESARMEWSLVDVAESGEGDRCLCGHHPVHDLCRMRNSATGLEALVGNCCAKRFMGMHSDAIFSGIKRVAANPSKSLGDEALALATRNGWITGWEEALYRKASQKKGVTDSQAAKKAEINERILARVRAPALGRVEFTPIVPETLPEGAPKDSDWVPALGIKGPYDD